MRIVLLSDTHNQLDRVTVPDGDLLIHCGDATNGGSEGELRLFNAHLNALPHPMKLFVPGNHDRLFESEESRARELVSEALVLIDEVIHYEGFFFHGTPWTNLFGPWAFMGSEFELKDRYGLIPPELDILISHGPPKYILDANEVGSHTGSNSLTEIVRERKPRFHVFGHIHESYGEAKTDGTTYLNVATCDSRYRPTNDPVVLDILPNGGRLK